MSLLTTTELASLRSEILFTLGDTCSISRPTQTVDDYGNYSEAGSIIATGVQCRLDPFTRQDAAGMLAMREAGRTWFRLTLPYDTNIVEGDSVVIGAVTYELIQLHDTHSERLVKRAVVARIQGD